MDWRRSRQVAAICLLLLLLASCGRQVEEVPQPVPDVEGLTVDAPASVTAGSPITVRIEAQNQVTAPVLVTLDGSAGFVPMPLTLEAGETILDIAGAHTRFAGTLTVSVRAGAVQAATDIAILPGEAADPVLPLVGPRSIVVGGQDRTMVVAIPLDARGNPVADNTPVTVYARHPFSRTAVSVGAPTIETLETRTGHLLSWVRVAGRNDAGDMLLAAQADSAYSPERTVRVVPDVPADIAVSAWPDGLAADGRQLATLITDPISDRFGNLMLDGMSVEFLVTDEAGRLQRIPAVTIDGRARATLQAPREAGTLAIRAVMAGVESRPVTLTFVAGPAVTDFPVEVIFAPEEIALVAGPLIGALNQFVPDGTSVTFSVQGVQSAPHVVSAHALDGYATATLRTAALEPGVYDVTATAGTGQGHVSFQVR